MITFNNERTVEMALKSLHWVDEIVVVDSFSTDRTPDIVKEYAATWEQRPWPGFRDQYQYASEKCTHDWILFIDADEEISPSLAEEMQRKLNRDLTRSNDSQIQGYYAPRRTYYLGRWHLHGSWVPDSEIRLYNKHRGRWKGGLHANVHVDGPTEYLTGFYYHYTYENISDQLQTIDKYSTNAAQDMVADNIRFSYRRLLGNPLAHFFRDYLLKGGFREGLPGLIVSLTTMFYVFIKYAKLWEARQNFPEFGDRSNLP
jgi:glycosyltransferase involved in cell wall biosynthesis